MLFACFVDFIRSVHVFIVLMTPFSGSPFFGSNFLLFRPPPPASFSASPGVETVGGTPSWALLAAHVGVPGDVRRERGAPGRDHRPGSARSRLRGRGSHLDLPFWLGRDQRGEIICSTLS